MEKVKIGIINVLDCVLKGIYEDIFGKVVVVIMEEYLISEWEYVYVVIFDEVD